MGEMTSYSQRGAIVQLVALVPMITFFSWLLRVELYPFTGLILAFAISMIPVTLYIILAPTGYRKLTTSAILPASWITLIEGIGSIIIGFFFIAFFYLTPLTEVLSNPRVILWIVFTIAWLLTGILEILVAFVIRSDMKIHNFHDVVSE